MSKKNTKNQVQHSRKNKKIKNAVKLDQVIKSLFAVSKNVLVTMMQSLFNEDIVASSNLDEIEIEYSNTEFVDYEYNVFRGDLMLKIPNDKRVKQCYHIEFQTKNDATMVIRMFRYGFNKAVEESTYKAECENKIRQVIMPRQLVIFIEENENIQDTLKMQLILPDGQEVLYEVDVFKMWNYSSTDLLDKKLYTLLPLKIFNLRYKLDKISIQVEGANGEVERLIPKEEISKASNEIKKLAEEIAYMSKELYDTHIITGEDLHKMLLALGNLCSYIDGRYHMNNVITKEANDMLKTLYDPAVEKRGYDLGYNTGYDLGVDLTRHEEKKALVKEAMEMNLDDAIIIKLGRLTPQELEELKKEIVNLNEKA